MAATATKPLSKKDYARLASEHLADFRQFLADLPDEKWNEASLCDGWQVRDVVGHLTIGRVIPVSKILVKLAAGGFKLAKVDDRETRAFGESKTPAELRAIFNEETRRPKERGLAGIEPPNAKLADNVTHLLDICVPLGLDPKLPADRLAATLDALRVVGMWKSNKKAKGLRLVADDIGWSAGEGPEVRGSAASLILALGGRSAGLDGLTGDGVAILRDRL